MGDSPRKMTPLTGVQHHWVLRVHECDVNIWDVTLGRLKHPSDATLIHWHCINFLCAYKTDYKTICVCNITEVCWGG